MEEQGKKVRYGAFVREISIKQRQISFNHLSPRLEKD